MDGFAPGLRDSILALSTTLRVVLFFICVAGLMLQVNRARADQESLVKPVVRAIVVVALIGTLPYWFGFTEEIFLSASNVVEEGYTEHPMRTAALIREKTADADHSFSLRRVGESLYRASLWAAAKLIILLGSLLQLPFLLLQYLLKLLCFLFLPVALALFMIPSLTGIATRYVQQTLAVLAWPVGFAVTELVAYYLFTGYQNNLAAAYGLASGDLDPASLASLLGALLGVLWLVIGTVATPFLMQMLFCSGAPFGGGTQSALGQLYQMQQIARLVAAVKTGGAAAPALAAQGASSTPRPPPSAGGASGPAASAPPPTGGGNSSGDLRAQAAIAQTQIPTAHTTI